MIQDERTKFAESETLILSTGTRNIGDVIDTGLARDIGQGQPTYLIIVIGTAVDSSGDGATIEWQLVSDSTGTISTSAASVHVRSGVITEANLTSGARFVLPLPPEGSTLPYEQFLALQAVIAVENVTAGSVDAFLSLDPAGNKSYPDALTVV